MTFVRLIGYLAFTEVYFLLTAPWRLGRNLRFITRGVGGTFTALWVGWMTVALMSDLINGVPLELMARGVSRAVFTGLAIISVFLICIPSWKRYNAILLGIPVSMVISLFIFKPGQQDVYASTLGDALEFQTSLNYILTAAILALTAVLYKRWPILTTGGLFSAGPVYILLGSRSTGAIFVAAAVTTLILGTFVTSKRAVARKVPWWKLAVFGVCGVSLTLSMAITYDYLASHELLDERQVRKYRKESQAEGGVFFGSRGVYILTGLLASWDRPLFGHGSWPEDSNGYYDRAAALLKVPGEGYNFRSVQGAAVRNMLPVHSVLVSALAEHGPLAFLFFAYIAYLNVSALRIVPSMLPQYTALYSILLWLNTWNLIASPQSHRIPTAMSFGFLLLVHFQPPPLDRPVGRERQRHSPSN